MQDVVPFGQIFYCTARCKQGRDTITKKILLLGKRLNAKRDELGDSRPLGHREYYTKTFTFLNPHLIDLRDYGIIRRLT